MIDQVIVAFSTCPDEGTAKAIAEALVTEGHAACVNRIANVRSSYIWDGVVRNDAEILLMIKSTAARLPQLRARLMELHPYELPELIAANVVGGNEEYLEWVRQGGKVEGDAQ